MLDLAKLLDTLTDLLGHPLHPLSHRLPIPFLLFLALKNPLRPFAHNSTNRLGLLLLHARDNLRAQLQILGKHHVRRDQQLERRAIVARPERTAHHPRPRAHGTPVPAIPQRLGRHRREPLEAVRTIRDQPSTRVGPLAHRLGRVQDRHDGGLPPLMARRAATASAGAAAAAAGPLPPLLRGVDKEARILGARVIVPAKLQECGQRVELVLALKDDSRVVRRENAVVRVAVVPWGHVGL